MQILLSPAKSLNETFPAHFSQKTTIPLFFEQTQILAHILAKKSPTDLQTLFSVSEKIADLNFGRYQNFPEIMTQDNSYPALTCFDGAVYKPIQTALFTNEDWAFAQKHLITLSGLYGILRPLDLLYPYRLEMGTKLENPAGKNLYEFWKNIATEYLNNKNEVIVNLASQEYFKVVDTNKLKSPIIHVHFKEQKGETFKVVAIHAKKARGAMANELVKQKTDNHSDIKKIEILGYRFSPEDSNETNYVFVR